MEKKEKVRQVRAAASKPLFFGRSLTFMGNHMIIYLFVFYITTGKPQPHRTGASAC